MPSTVTAPRPNSVDVVESVDIVEVRPIPPKPKLRGWVHAAAAPLALAAGIVLIVISPPIAGRVGTVVFTFTALQLFSMSAIYHLGNWQPRTHAVLRRIDHASIFCIIAGTYTPLAILLLEPSSAQQMLLIVWIGALAGSLGNVLWINAPRWLYVPVYLALGWVAVGYLSELWNAGGPAVVFLIFGGGLAYSTGAVIYGLKRPNPSPRWFGFHEVFHTLTVAGFTCHLIAIFIAATRA